MLSKWNFLAIAGILVSALAVAVPAGAVFIPVNPGGSHVIQDAINGAGYGDTIILSPGMYSENGIIITKDITISADASNGHDPHDTIIDGKGMPPRIITVLSTATVTLENLTLQNGRAEPGADGADGAPGSAGSDGASGSDGGAIYGNGFLNIISSVISGCSAGNGGSGGNGGTQSGSPGRNGGNGGSGGNGGAIDMTGNVRIVSSHIKDCSAGNGGNGGRGSPGTSNGAGGSGGSGGSGGAVRVIGTATIISSTIADCSAGRGGIGSPGSPGGSGGAGGNGGAIQASGQVSVTSSRIGKSSAGTGGTGGAGSAGTLGHCDWNAHMEPVGNAGSRGGTGGAGGNGGAISSPGPIRIETSFITVCSGGSGGSGGPGGPTPSNIIGGSGNHGGSGGSGGAVFSEGSIEIISTTISGSTSGNGGIGGSGGYGQQTGGAGGIGGAGGNGGAASGSPVTITGSAITGCSAGDGGNGNYGGGSPSGSVASGSGGAGGNGGAIFSSGTVTGTSSVFSACSAGSGGISPIGGTSASAGTGSAIAGTAWGGVHFSRIVSNGRGPAVHGSLDATNNWWGSNANPVKYTGGGAASDPWLVLGISAVPGAIGTLQTSMVRAGLTGNSAGTDTSGSGRVPDGLMAVFTAEGGTAVPGIAATRDGAAETVFSPSSQGTKIVSATVDGQTVTTAITVTPGGSGSIATTSIVIDSQTPSVLYAGVDGAGVYRSTNSGDAWTAATTQPANNRIRALVIRPGDSSTLYAATYGGGVFRSTGTGTIADNGMVWEVCTNKDLANLNVISLAIDPSGTLYAGTEAGVFVSTDGCASWSATNNGLP